MFEEHYVNFCKELQAWLSGKEKQPEWVSTTMGLCSNFWFYLDSKGIGQLASERLTDKQYEYYKKTFGTGAYVFNNAVTYDRETSLGTIFHNRERLAHIKAVAEQGLPNE